MRLRVMDIPDDPADQAAWLDGHLAGVHLGDLVAELAAIHLPGDDPLSLDEALEGTYPAVLAGGLAHAPPAAIPRLLTQPGLLLELQERLLESGSPYWDVLVAADADLAELHGRLVEPAAPPVVPFRRRPWVVALATAAALVLVGFGLVRLGVVSFPTAAVSEPAVAWGWARPGAIPDDADAGGYYDALARAAKQWFDRRPDDAVALARRIGEFRNGCSELLLAPHRPLGPDEAEWLVARCHRWAERLDRLRDDLERGRPVAEVRAAVDDLTRRVVLNLESRAGHVRSLAG